MITKLTIAEQSAIIIMLVPNKKHTRRNYESE
jgi:hypothetical protein